MFVRVWNTSDRKITWRKNQFVESLLRSGTLLRSWGGEARGEGRTG
jgi:hypothetical protein